MLHTNGQRTGDCIVQSDLVVRWRGAGSFRRHVVIVSSLPGPLFTVVVVVVVVVVVYYF